MFFSIVSYCDRCFNPVVTLSPTFSPMKKTRLLGYFLAATACALSVPACGGGGEGSRTYISVQQFANGAKAFKIDGNILKIYSDGSGGEKMEKGQADGILNGSGYGPSSPSEQLSPQGEYEGKMDIGGWLAFDDGTKAKATLSYGTYGGETGIGVLQIIPASDAFVNGSNVDSMRMINFLGGVTKDQMNNGSTTSGNSYTQLNSDYPRLLLFSIAGCRYRAVIDFASGMMDFFLTYASTFEAAALDANGNPMEGYHVTLSEIIDALRVSKTYIVEPI